MITIYNVLYAKSEWTRASAIAHLTENGVSDILQCEETDRALAFTLCIKPKEDTKPSRMLSLTDSVCLIIKDLNIPDASSASIEEIKEEEKSVPAEQKDASSSSSAGFY